MHHWGKSEDQRFTKKKREQVAQMNNYPRKKVNVRERGEVSQILAIV